MGRFYCLWFYSLIKYVMNWIIWGECIHECIHWMHSSEWIHTCLASKWSSPILNMRTVCQSFPFFVCLQASDLKLLMSKLEHWGHRLFPKMTFDELISRLEKLGQKKDVQVSTIGRRATLLLSDSSIVACHSLCRTYVLLAASFILQFMAKLAEYIAIAWRTRRSLTIFSVIV